MHRYRHSSKMLDLRFSILQGKVAEVAKMNLSLKLYTLTNESHASLEKE